MSFKITKHRNVASSATVGDDADAKRCHCGALLARLVPGGVELKCRRCRRIVVLPLDELRARGSVVVGP